MSLHSQHWLLSKSTSLVKGVCALVLIGAGLAIFMTLYGAVFAFLRSIKADLFSAIEFLNEAHYIPLVIFVLPFAIYLYLDSRLKNAFEIGERREVLEKLRSLKTLSYPEIGIILKRYNQSHECLSVYEEKEISDLIKTAREIMDSPEYLEFKRNLLKQYSSSLAQKNKCEFRTEAERESQARLKRWLSQSKSV